MWFTVSGPGCVDALCGRFLCCCLPSCRRASRGKQAKGGGVVTLVLLAPRTINTLLGQSLVSWVHERTPPPPKQPGYKSRLSCACLPAYLPALTHHTQFHLPPFFISSSAFIKMTIFLSNVRVSGSHFSLFYLPICLLSSQVGRRMGMTSLSYLNICNKLKLIHCAGQFQSPNPYIFILVRYVVI